MSYTYIWDQPQHIQDFNISLYELELEADRLQKKIDKKKAFIKAMWSASFVEEAMTSAEGSVN